MARSPEDLARAAEWLERLRGGGDVRRTMVRRVRNAIRTQDYENLLKLDIAAQRIAEELEMLARLNEKH